MSFRKRCIDIVTMGCSKNLIDSERLIKRLSAKGYEVCHNPEILSGEYVIVNTCGFIGDAKEESINFILELTRLKQKDRIKKIVVMGCLSERYRQELPLEIPEVDLWYGKFDWKTFINSLPDLNYNPTSTISAKEWERTLTTPPWSAYIKISEGCDRFCAYCAIPYITGRHTSRPMEEIIEEVENLAQTGVKEFNVIAQDLSSYGTDLYGRHSLPEIIEHMATIQGVEWIRLHYLYPTDFPLELLDVINRHDNVCKYLDIALQHISDRVLHGMNRNISKEETLRLLAMIREKVPGIHIRTTIMTGFPGEGEDEFKELLEFISTQKFERLGGFVYSEEEDTLAAKNLKDIIPQEIKDKRLAEVMTLQEEISSKLNEDKIGKEMKVLIEENKGEFAIGRTEYDSPEVDQEVIIENEGLQPGTFVKVKITDTAPFMLKGKLIK